jgi:cysteine desulfurase
MAEPRRVYLDYNATAPLRAGAREAMQRASDAGGGNPSSVHAEGRLGRRLLEEAREEIAQRLGALPAEVVLTASATEANHLALESLCPRGGTLVTTAVEHPSIEQVAQRGAATRSWSWTRLEVGPDGRVEMGRARAEVPDRVDLVSFILAHNETGTLQPWVDLVALARERRALVHVDATQALGRVPIEVGQLGVDLLTASSHKLGGPVGAGLCWVRRDLELGPLLVGGHQERGRRAGTENVPAAVGLAAALREATRDLPAEAARLARLRDRLWEGILALEPDARLLGSRAYRLPNTLQVAFPGADGETLLMALDLAGVAVSMGSACSAGSLEPSPALLAMGVSEAEARSAIRLSLGHASTDGEVGLCLERLPPALEAAREGAP